VTVENILLDLDGTLTDPKIGIHTCIRYAMEKMGQPLTPDTDLDWTIGPPLKASFFKLLDTTQDDLAEQALITIVSVFQLLVYMKMSYIRRFMNLGSAG